MFNFTSLMIHMNQLTDRLTWPKLYVIFNLFLRPSKPVTPWKQVDQHSLSSPRKLWLLVCKYFEKSVTPYNALTCLDFTNEL